MDQPLSDQLAAAPGGQSPALPLPRHRAVFGAERQPAQGWRDDPAAPDRFLFLIGAMKAGTTSLFQYLAQHPQIAASRDKEVGFFALEPRMQNGFDWYLGQWDWQPGRHRAALEASTHYTKLPAIEGVPENLAQIASPEDKFLYIMRHPLKRLESHMPFIQATNAELSPLIDRLDRYERHARGRRFTDLSLEYSRYAMQLDTWAERFGRERILLLTMEALQADPAAVLNRVCDFAGLDRPARWDGLGETHNAGSEVIALPPWLRLTVGSGWAKSAIQAMLPKALRDRLRGALGRRPGEKFTLTPEEREDALALLRDDLSRLRDHYGVDITAEWGIEI